MKRRPPQLLLGFGLLSAGLLLMLLEFGAYPVQSLRGEPATARPPRFQAKSATHVASAAGSEFGIVQNPQTATSGSTQNIAVPTGGSSVQRALASTTSSSGLVINATFDSSITNNANAIAIEAAINQAIAIYESQFSDPIVVSILFRYSTTSPNGSPLGAGAVAQSGFVVYQVPWDEFVTPLRADATTSNDSTAAAGLPSFALSPNILPSSANGRAVGLDTPPAMGANGSVGNGLPYDGIITLNSGQSFDFVRPTDANSFDALRAIEHEMDEVLGLGSYLGHTGSDIRPQDLFSWSSVGNRNLSSSGSRYFSIDGGQTDIVGFNQTSGGDFGDWLSTSCPQAQPYVQNAFGCKGQSSDISATSPEGINLDVVGYDLIAAVSAPSAPTAQAATNVTNSGFTANWQGVAGATGYRLDVSTNNSFSSFVSGYNDLDVGNVTSANVSGLSINVTYYYRVRAYNNSGTSGNSNTVSVTTTASTPTPTPTVTPTVSPGPDVSVAWQINPVHDGNNSASSLVPPLNLKWQKDFASAGVGTISYPLIAQGLIIVTTSGNSGNLLVALDEGTGQQVWSKAINGTYGFVNAAYDAGRVFVVNYDGVMQAFDAANGTPRWSVKLPNQYSFTSPPTAANGKVFVGGAGVGGTLYAVDQTNGNVLWTGSVENGDHSSPAVTSTSVFVSYACPQSYAFAPGTGQQQWHYSGPCEGGGGKTPVFHLGNLYVRDSFFTPTNGLVLNATTGANLDGFSSDVPPAFVGNLGVYLQSGTLRGIDLPSGQVLWSFAGDGGLDSTTLVVNNVIYTGSSSGQLYALDLQGNQIWSTEVGAGIAAPDEHNAILTTGLGAGDGLLVVPAGSVLAVYGGSGATPTPTPTSTITPTPTPTVTPTPSPTPTPTGNYTISVSVSPIVAGTASGGGNYAPGASVTVMALPNNGFNFANWIENGSIVSTSASYQFTANSNRTLTANFVAYPTIFFSALPATVRKGGTASFIVSGTTINPSQPIIVHYFPGGTATPNFDYTLSGAANQITIPPGQASGSVTLTVITAKTRGREKATLTLIPSSGYNLGATAKRRSRRNPNQATVTILNR